MNARPIVLLLCLLSISLPAVAQYPLADRMPAESVVYVGWAGRSLTFDGSMLGQMLNEPAVASLVESLRALATEQVGADGQAMDNALSIAATAWQHPIALVLLPPAEGGPPIPMPILLIDLGEDRESFAEDLDALLAAAEAEIEEISLGAMTCQVVSTGGPPLVIGYIDNLLVLTMDPDLILQVSQLAEAESLQQDARFIATMETVSGEAVQLATYVDVASVREIVNSFMPPAPEGEADSPFNSRDIHGIWRGAGMDEVTAIAYTTRIVDRQLYTKMRILSPAPHRGYLMPFAGQPITDEDLAHVPADADFVAVVNISPVELLADARRGAGEITIPAPGGSSFEEAFDEAMMALQEQFGFSLEDDLLGSLGDTWVISSAASQGGFLTGTMMSAEVTDPDKLAEVVAKIEEISGALPELDEHGQPVEQPGPVQIKTTLAGQTEIHYLAGHIDVTIGGTFGVPLPYAPAWAIHEGRFYVAMWPQVLTTVFERETTKLLTDDPTFQAYRAKVASEPSMLCYINTPAIARQLYGYALIGGTVGTNMLASQGMNADPSWIPSLAAVEKYLSPEIYVVSADDEGITIENVASLPFLANLPGTTGLGTAMALPELHRIRGTAQKAASMANLKGLTVAGMAYEMDEMQRPPNLAALVENDFVSASMLRCPHNDDAPPEVIDGELVGESDYVYLLSPIHVARPSLHIVAYERPEHYKGEGTNVAFADGHVEFLSMGDFTRLLAKTETANAELADD